MAPDVFHRTAYAEQMQQLTGYFTETGRRPVDDVAKSALTGPATVILTGLSAGGAMAAVYAPADEVAGARRPAERAH